MKGTDRASFHDNIRNMVEVRACVYFSVFFLCFHLAAGKPFLGLLFCDWMCDDDDDLSSSTTTASTEDPWDLMLCGGCGTRRPPTPMTPNPLSFVIPASSNAMNLTWFPGSNGFMMIPWGQGGSPQANFAPTNPPPAAPTAGATTAAPTTVPAAT